MCYAGYFLSKYYYLMREMFGAHIPGGYKHKLESLATFQKNK